MEDNTDMASAVCIKVDYKDFYINFNNITNLPIYIGPEN